MSSNVQVILSALDATRAEVAALKAEVSALRTSLATKNTVTAAVSGSVSKVVEKKPRRKSDAPPTPWRLFTDRIRGVLAAADFKGKALGVECVQFCATLKDENADLDSWTTELVLARRASWTPPDVSRGEAKFGKGWAKTGERRVAAKAASASNSVVTAVEDTFDAELDGEGAVQEQPAKTAGRKWSAEAKAAAAAKRAAKKTATTSVTSTSTNSGETSGPVKSTTPPSPKVSATAATSNVMEGGSSSSVVFKPVMLGGGARYFVNMENGHAYHRLADGSQGEWAGIFKRDPKPRIDDSVPEPVADDGELRFE